VRFLGYITENDNYKTTKDQTGHTHDVMLNADGDGKTVATNGTEDHEHIVYQWVIQPAKGHIHNLDI